MAMRSRSSMFMRVFPLEVCSYDELESHVTQDDVSNGTNGTKKPPIEGGEVDQNSEFEIKLRWPQNPRLARVHRSFRHKLTALSHPSGVDTSPVRPGDEYSDCSKSQGRRRRAC